MSIHIEKLKFRFKPDSLKEPIKMNFASFWKFQLNAGAHTPAGLCCYQDI